jgi:hypothetical protein
MDVGTEKDAIVDMVEWNRGSGNRVAKCMVLMKNPKRLIEIASGSKVEATSEPGAL